MAQLRALSIGAQALYTYLTSNADDDGFVDYNGNELQFEIMGIELKYLQELIDQGYVLKLEDALVYIINWTKQNAIPPDRYTKSIYFDKYFGVYDCVQSGLKTYITK